MSIPEQSGDSFDFCVLFRVYFTGKGGTALTCKPDWKPIAHSRHISMGELADSRTERSA